MEVPNISLKHQIYTYSGKLCSVEEPPSIEDIVTALGRIARFSGNTLLDFNVMAHSIHVAYILWSLGHPELVLQGLVHDFTECMFGDIPTPFKNGATRYLEKYAGANIFRSHGYTFEIIYPLVYTADKISLIMEAKELLQGDAWKTILSSIEIDEHDVNEIDDAFLEELIKLCEYDKQTFRPGGLVYTSVLELIAKLKLSPINREDLILEFFRIIDSRVG
jgi:hypothetical protein